MSSYHILVDPCSAADSNACDPLAQRSKSMRLSVCRFRMPGSFPASVLMLIIHDKNYAITKAYQH